MWPDERNRLINLMEHTTSLINGTKTNGISQPEQSRPPASRQRVTVSLPLMLIERLRNAVYWTDQRTLAQVIVDSLEDTLTAMEHANGGPFPGRLAPLKAGRRPRKQPPAPIIATESASGACVTS
jgi:hypothetical protein